MRLRKLHLYLAGLVAFLIGMPLSGKAFGQDGRQLVEASVDLASAIVNLSDGRS